MPSEDRIDVLAAEFTTNISAPVRGFGPNARVSKWRRNKP